MTALNDGLWELERRALCDDAGAAAVLKYIRETTEFNQALQAERKAADVELGRLVRREMVTFALLVLVFAALIIMAPGEW